MPALVPQCYKNPYSGSSNMRSGGLGGELRIILGLMAFHGKTGSDVFEQGLWHSRQWRGPSTAPKSCK